MKPAILFLLTLVFFTLFFTPNPCGEYKGHPLYRGPKGGCYYINGNGNKTYVDRGLCNC